MLYMVPHLYKHSHHPCYQIYYCITIVIMFKEYIFNCRIVGSKSKGCDGKEIPEHKLWTNKLILSLCSNIIRFIRKNIVYIWLNYYLQFVSFTGNFGRYSSTGKRELLYMQNISARCSGIYL